MRSLKTVGSVFALAMICAPGAMAYENRIGSECRTTTSNMDIKVTGTTNSTGYSSVKGYDYIKTADGLGYKSVESTSSVSTVGVENLTQSGHVNTVTNYNGVVVTVN